MESIPKAKLTQLVVTPPKSWEVIDISTLHQPIYMSG